MQEEKNIKNIIHSKDFESSISLAGGVCTLYVFLFLFDKEEGEWLQSKIMEPIPN